MAYMPSPSTQNYLSGWLTKSSRYQASKGRIVDLSLNDFIQLWGDRRLKKLDAWLEAGMRDGRMHRSNPFAFVLTWKDREATKVGVMNLATAKVSTRMESQKAGRFTKGDSHTPEARKRIGAAKAGKSQSDEHRLKRSDAQKGKKRGPMSDAHKAAIAAGRSRGGAA